jgi:prevent-host-death family protein
MTPRSLAHAKAHLSELVDEAEHHGKRIVILRHGKPAAAIVPVEVAVPKKAKVKRMSAAEARAFFDAAGMLGDPDKSAIDDLLASRR